GVTDGAHAVGLALGGRFLADPELHRVEAVVDVAPRRRRKLIGREAVPEPVAAIRRQTIAIAAEQAMQRLSERLARGVPHGDVERRERAMEEPTRPDPIAASREPVPRGLRLEHAEADEVLAELAR